MNFQEMIFTLQHYWAAQGCLVQQGYDLEVGAGTFNPATFLRSLGPEPYASVYVEPSRRPKDGRYGQNPNRVQFYHQMQVIIKPAPLNLQELYLASLEAIGLDLAQHDMRFVHDDWENPTIGAWGLGWEVWADGMEVSQYTYFQAVGGIPVHPVSGELTYGLERLALYLQGKDSFFDLRWNEDYLYGDIYKRNEWEWSHYNFGHSNAEMWKRHFEDFEQEAQRLVREELPIPAYDFVMKASHAFNMLDARGCIGVSERAVYIGRVRALAKLVAEGYIASREKQGFPLLRLSPKNVKNRNVSVSVSDQMGHTGAQMCMDIKEPPPPSLAGLPSATSVNERTADLLIEIGCEELPATFVEIGMANLKKEMEKLLKAHSIPFRIMECYGTPRRLALLVRDLAAQSPKSDQERKGPSLAAAFDQWGQLTAAGLGFFQSLGLAPCTRDLLPSTIEVRTTRGGDYLFARSTSGGMATSQLLAEALPSLILELDFPKKMRWSDFYFSFARPLRWIVALFGEEVVPFTCGHLTSGRLSYGHRQLSPDPLAIQSAGDYVSLLRDAQVMVDPRERREQIQSAMTALKKRPVHAERVMAQVVHLVEWPFIILCSFDAAYLRAPKEVLISEMIEHQKSFPLMDEAGELESHFIVVSNQTPSDLIRRGHERALAPRLADGMFLFEEDRKKRLVIFQDKLKGITFQRDLGTMADKVARMKQLVRRLHAVLPLAPLPDVEEAVELCKVDLATELVGEFPELQGVIGRLYAQEHGVKPEIALAIDEHWMPRGEHAPLHQSGCGTLLSLAEKIDNLESFF